MSNLIETELETILKLCQANHLPVFVIGAFSLRAYNCLLRVSQDLDLAVSEAHFAKLKQLLLAQGYTVGREAVWVTATKTIHHELVEINIALNGITDLNSASTFLISPPI